jgi:methionyl-tRNA formyltransferase
MSNMSSQRVRVLALCTVSGGLDAVAEVLRQGGELAGIVGLPPDSVDPDKVSGWIDVASFARKWGLEHYYVQRYDLRSVADRNLLEGLTFDLLWVVGWQRLVPDWLIACAKLGAIGAHGSADGITGGRGRSPQNWALMLGCRQFDMALFRITPGVDEGPVISAQSFYYNDTDDIRISYQKSSLVVASMMLDVLANPSLLDTARSQSSKASYYPQRKPEDGIVDWKLTQKEIWAHCRALTMPYPGLRSLCEGGEITIWECIPFDELIGQELGAVSACFEDGSFLVCCGDGRLIVREWICSRGDWAPAPGARLRGIDSYTTLTEICERHRARYPDAPVSRRILNRLEAQETEGQIANEKRKGI